MKYYKTRSMQNLFCLQKPGNFRFSSFQMKLRGVITTIKLPRKETPVKCCNKLIRHPVPVHFLSHRVVLESICKTTEIRLGGGKKLDGCTHVFALINTLENIC